MPMDVTSPARYPLDMHRDTSTNTPGPGTTAIKVIARKSEIVAVKSKSITLLSYRAGTGKRLRINDLGDIPLYIKFIVG